VDVVGALLGLVIGGALIGALARLAIPGPDPMPFWLTVLFGAAGAILGGGIGYAVGGAVGYFFGAVLVASILVVVYRRFVQHRGITGPDAMMRPTRGLGVEPPKQDEALAQLERLAELRDRGAITPEEFAAKKAELLGRI
jgi:uncharacterized membrane protein YeaQ/YmgE (transglycosylase-associated protein family)